MKTGAVNHIGINTVNLKETEKFYQDIMKFSFMGEYDLGGDYVAFMKVNGTTVLELFRTDGTLRTYEPGDGNIGLKHVAFDVDDVDEWNVYLQEKGCRVTFGPADIEPIKKRVLLFQAPDNVILELSADMQETDKTAGGR